MSGWETIVDLQDDLIRFWMSRDGQIYGSGFGESMINSILRDADVEAQASAAGWKPEDAVDESQWMRHLAELEAKKLMMAEPIYVNGEVKGLIEAAAETWEPEQLKAEDVFPTLYGFMVFPEPFTVKDRHGKNLSFRAISWCPIDKARNELPNSMRSIAPQDAGGLFLAMYSHKDDPDDYPLTDWPGREPTLTLCYVTPWHFSADAPIDVNMSGLWDAIKIVQVSWRLAAQTITSPERATLPKAFRKRATRAGLVSDVTLITLRHQVTKPNAEPQQVDWQHRWIVRGHWHKYHYADGTTKQLWLAPYVKGPEDKPLKVKALRVFELTR